MRVRRGLGCPGGRSGSHGGPQGRAGAPTCPKTTFEVPPGPPLWVTIFGTFCDFSVFRCMFFLRVVLEGFRERFRGNFGTIFEGHFKDLLYNFRCTLHIAKPHFDMVFVMFEAHRCFQKSSQKIQKMRILRHISQIRVRRRFRSHFGWILGAFSEALGTQIGKMRSKKHVKKRVVKKSRKVVRVIPRQPTHGGGCPYKDQRSETLEGRSARIEGLRA